MDMTHMAATSREQSTAAPIIVPMQSVRIERLSHPARARLAVEILAAYVESRRALRREPIATVIERLRARSPSATPPAAVSLAEARRLGRAVARLLAYVPGDTRCLARSLVLTRLLASRGIEAKLVIGARTTPSFLAHAWVEHDGKPVIDPGDDSFGRLVEL
jgi:hypothetical protein